MQKLLLVYYYSESRATSHIGKVLPNMVFPRFFFFWGGGGGGVVRWRSAHAHASYPGLPGLSFRTPRFSPYRGWEERLDYVRPTWLDIAQVLFSVFIDRDGVEENKACCTGVNARKSTRKTRMKTANRRLVSSVGRAPDCCVGGRGFDPQTGPTLRVLK